MSRSSVPWIESLVVNAALAAHPYRDAILADLDDARAEVEATAGADEARRWYRDEARRSLLPIVSSLPIAPTITVPLLAMVLLVYIAVVRIAGGAGLELERMLGKGSGLSFVVSYLALVAVAGGIGGFVVTVMAQRYAVVAALSMAAITVAVGAVHLFRGAPNEFWFRFSMLLVFALSVVVGLFAGIVVVARSISWTRPTSGQRREPNR